MEDGVTGAGQQGTRMIKDITKAIGLRESSGVLDDGYCYKTDLTLLLQMVILLPGICSKLAVLPKHGWKRIRRSAGKLVIVFL